MRLRGVWARSYQHLDENALLRSALHNQLIPKLSPPPALHFTTSNSNSITFPRTT